jgi:membrane associated rhomboid family serine protease
MSTWYSHLFRGQADADTLRKAVTQYRTVEASITRTLIWVVAIMFSSEIFVTAIFGIRSIRVFATGLFKIKPELAWMLAPVLHAGFKHVLTNIGGLVLMGFPLEQHFTKRRFAIFVIGTAYLSTMGGWFAQTMFTTNQIAMYGISGTVYALAGYGLVHFGLSTDRLSAFEWIAMMFGLGAAVTVVIDPFTGPYLHPDWINGGHATGFLIGVITRVVR